MSALTESSPPLFVNVIMMVLFDSAFFRRSLHHWCFLVTLPSWVLPRLSFVGITWAYIIAIFFSAFIGAAATKKPTNSNNHPLTYPRNGPRNTDLNPLPRSLPQGEDLPSYSYDRPSLITLGLHRYYTSIKAVRSGFAGTERSTSSSSLSLPVDRNATRH